MTRPRLLPALRAGACLALLALAACAELEPPAVTIGESVLTVGDLRAIWADIPTPQRPPLSTREERRAFVDQIVERRLLAAQGERLLGENPGDFAADFEAIETEILVRRLRVLEGGESAIDSVAIAEAAERMSVVHYVEWISFTTRQAAEEAARKIGGGTDFEEIRDDPQVGGSAGERSVVWSPFSDPLADLVSGLEIGSLAGPIQVGGEWLVVRVNRREASDLAESPASVSTVARGLRTRRQNAAIERLQRRLWLQAGLEIEEDGIARLVARTVEAILRPGATEHDPDWAVPSLAPGEESVGVASAGGEAVYTSADYVATVRRRTITQRPRGGNLAYEIRRLVEDDLGRRLLREEAIRRGLREEWYTRRLLRTERENRLVQVAVQSIERRRDSEPAGIDTLLASLRESGAEVFHRPARARILRLDLPTRPAAIRELANLHRAGNPLARLRDVLQGRGAPLAGTYHLTHLVPGAIGIPTLDKAVFEGGPGTLTGPFEVGNVWILVHCLEVEPAYDLDEEQARRELAVSFGKDTGAVPRWVQSRRLELRVAVDEEALDELGAAA